MSDGAPVKTFFMERRAMVKVSRHDYSSVFETKAEQTSMRELNRTIQAVYQQNQM
jgi:hypothetical protein